MAFPLATTNGQELALKLKSNCHPELGDGQGNRFQLRTSFQLVVACCNIMIS